MSHPFVSPSSGALPCHTNTPRFGRRCSCCWTFGSFPVCAVRNNAASLNCRAWGSPTAGSRSLARRPQTLPPQPGGLSPAPGSTICGSTICGSPAPSLTRPSEPHTCSKPASPSSPACPLLPGSTRENWRPSLPRCYPHFPGFVSELSRPPSAPRGPGPQVPQDSVGS